MITKAQIELLDGMRLREEGDSQWTQMRSGGLLIAYLILHSEFGIERKKCVYDLYPDEEYEVSGNRIRVALTRFKKVFGENLISDGSMIQMRLDGIEVDYVAAQEQFREIGDEIEVDAERELLFENLATLRKELLPEATDLWLRAWQEEWRKDCLRLIKRLITLETESGNWDRVVVACQAGFVHDAGDVGLWRNYLGAYKALGDLEKGESELEAAASDELTNEAVAELRGVVRELKREDIDLTGRWSDAQLARLGRVLARSIEDEPTEAAKFLMTGAAIGEFYREPAAFLPFLHEIVDQEGVELGAQQDMRLRIMDAAGLKYDWEEVIRQTDILMEEEIDPARLGRAFFGRSFALFQMRDYAGALKMIGESTRVYHELGDEVRTVNSRAVEGSYRWHGGEYDLGLKIYSDAREFLATQDTPVAKGNLAINWANVSTVYAILGRWEDGLDAVRNCFAAMEVTRNENMLAMVNTVAGLIFVVNGETKKGVDLLVDGLKRSYRRDSSREIQIGLEWAAGALADGGKLAEAKATMDWVGDWRERTGHARSVAEKLYADRVLGECAAAPLQPIHPDEDVRKVVCFVIRHLREMEG